MHIVYELGLRIEETLFQMQDDDSRDTILLVIYFVLIDINLHIMLLIQKFSICRVSFHKILLYIKIHNCTRACYARALSLWAPNVGFHSIMTNPLGCHFIFFKNYWVGKLLWWKSNNTVQYSFLKTLERLHGLPISEPSSIGKTAPESSTRTPASYSRNPWKG